MRDVELLQQGIEIGLAATPVGLNHFQYGADIVLDVQTAEDRCFLRQVADPEPSALVHRKSRDVVAVELDLSAIGLDQSGDHVEDGGLAGAIRSEQADGFPSPHMDARSRYDLTPAKAFLDPVSSEARPPSGRPDGRPASINWPDGRLLTRSQPARDAVELARRQRARQYVRTPPRLRLFARQIELLDTGGQDWPAERRKINMPKSGSWTAPTAECATNEGQDGAHARLGVKGLAECFLGNQPSFCR